MFLLHPNKEGLHLIPNQLAGNSYHSRINARIRPSLSTLTSTETQAYGDGSTPQPHASSISNPKSDQYPNNPHSPLDVLLLAFARSSPASHVLCSILFLLVRRTCPLASPPFLRACAPFSAPLVASSCSRFGLGSVFAEGMVELCFPL